MPIDPLSVAGLAASGINAAIKTIHVEQCVSSSSTSCVSSSSTSNEMYFYDKEFEYKLRGKGGVPTCTIRRNSNDSMEVQNEGFSIFELMDTLAEDISEEEWKRVPPDWAEKFDQYKYNVSDDA